LAHEMGHARQRIEWGGTWYAFRNVQEAVREADVLRRFETPIANELGEPTRNHHLHGASGFRRMSNSTDWGVVITTTQRVQIQIPLANPRFGTLPISWRRTVTTFTNLNPWTP